MRLGPFRRSRVRTPYHHPIVLQWYWLRSDRALMSECMGVIQVGPLPLTSLSHPHCVHLTANRGCLSRRPRAFICFARHCCLSYSSFLTWTSRCYGCIYTPSSLPFSCQAPSSPITFLPFWRRENETASAATALRTIFLSGTDVWAASIAFLKCDKLHSWSMTNWIPKARWSQSHTPPTENTHCKISSLALRRSAINIPQASW